MRDIIAPDKGGDGSKLLRGRLGIRRKSADGYLRKPVGSGKIPEGVMRSYNAFLPAGSQPSLEFGIQAVETVFQRVRVHGIPIRIRGVYPNKSCGNGVCHFFSQERA